MAKYQAAIFDFDGVLVDSEIPRLETYHDLFKREFDLELTISPRELMGYSEEENLKRICSELEIEKDIEELRSLRKPILLELAGKGVSVIQPIHEIIQKIMRQNIPVAVASNSSLDYVSLFFQHFNFEGTIPIFSGDSVTQKKPHPEIYLKAAQTLDVAPEKCLVFEDTPVGIEAAKEANMACVGVLSTLSEKELEKANFFLKKDEKDISTILEMLL